MRRQVVPLGKAAWATRRVSSGIEPAGLGWSDMRVLVAKGRPVEASGVDTSALDHPATAWQEGRWNSPPVSLLGLPLPGERSERIGALERGFSSPTHSLIIAVSRHTRRQGNNHAQAQTQPTPKARDDP